MNIRSTLRYFSLFAYLVLLASTTASFAADSTDDLFQISPATPTKNNPNKMAPSVLCDLTSKHLKLKPGATLHAVGRFAFPEEKYHVLLLGDFQADVYETTRGQFFEPIDTPEKAADLAMLQFSQGELIKTTEQYKKIVDSLKQISDFKPADFIKVENPEAFGISVTEVPGKGYAVGVLKFDFDTTYPELGFREVTLNQFAITRDGRMGRKETVCIKAPVRPTPSQDPNVKFFTPEFGLNGSPATAQTENAAIKAYNAAIKKALIEGGTEKITPPYKPTGEKSQIPFPVNEDFKYQK